ncbi:MAG: hypothetical protein IH892_11840 [Planctomycetes bacterium]|nr:hypothetical protein [Planctomycetota bacterium]
MKKTFTTLVILSCVAALIGCRDDSDSAKDIQKTEPNVSESNAFEANDSPSYEIPTIPPGDTFEIQGTVVYKNIEGGFFAIESDDGSKYDPINLPESFRRDGLKVKVSARFKKEAMSFHMYGAIIEVVNIAAQ